VGARGVLGRHGIISTIRTGQHEVVPAARTEYDQMERSALCGLSNMDGRGLLIRWRPSEVDPDQVRSDPDDLFDDDMTAVEHSSYALGKHGDPNSGTLVGRFVVGL
jgi:hypothetical protein